MDDIRIFKAHLDELTAVEDNRDVEGEIKDRFVVRLKVVGEFYQHLPVAAGWTVGCAKIVGAGIQIPITPVFKFIHGFHHEKVIVKPDKIRGDVVVIASLLEHFRGVDPFVVTLGHRDMIDVLYPSRRTAIDEDFAVGEVGERTQRIAQFLTITCAVLNAIHNVKLRQIHRYTYDNKKMPEFFPASYQRICLNFGITLFSGAHRGNLAVKISARASTSGVITRKLSGGFSILKHKHHQIFFSSSGSP